MSESGVWLYAVSAGLPDEVLRGSVGVGGERLRTVEQRGLVAIVGSVDLDEFGEASLRRKLDHLESLEAIARAHHAVVEAAAAGASTVPIRLATVYRDDAGIIDLLEQRHDDFTTALERFSGRAEWGVKAYAAPTSPPEPDSDLPPGDRTGPGTSYLLQRRAQLATVDNARQAAVKSAELVHSALSRLSVAARQHRPQDAELTGSAEWMVLNGAYLVNETQADEFADAIEKLAAANPAVRLETTGPWPPYSFTGGEGKEPGRAEDRK
ncbi:GvpL/GvpF family gas vesicle protein [Glycomyces sp. NPDC049804]|uniref:GvpL/GvpF family gas vesicle protein n=1 Tax=Glycomyces sp. NPDC049804 TaxID=3154363 RepID=UPI00343B09D5